MKIYILPVDQKYYKKPKIDPFCKHSPNFNVELGFHKFLLENHHYLTDDPREADWHYLPIYWSYWLLNNNYGNSGREKMSLYLRKIITNTDKTFTVSEADDEPMFGLDIKVFSATNTGRNWIPIPILTLPHKISDKPPKNYISSFVGNLLNHQLRIDMKDKLSNFPGVKIIQSKKGEDLFVDTMLQSYTALCPRGSSLSSYRFYEAMQLGVGPILISDVDFRPFKKEIPWNLFSYYVDSIDKLEKLLWSISVTDFRILEEKNKLAQTYWNLIAQSWCDLILEKL